MSFEHDMKEWIQTDNQLKELSHQIKVLREKRNALEQSLLRCAETNHMNNRVIQFKGVKLKFTNTKIAEPLTFRYLEAKLGEIIKNEDQRKYIVDYIKEKRECKVVPEIKRIEK